MSNEINDFNWNWNLIQDLKQPFDNKTKGSARNIHNHECSDLQNRNSEANEEKLFDNLDTLSQDDIVRKQQHSYHIRLFLTKT